MSFMDVYREGIKDKHRTAAAKKLSRRHTKRFGEGGNPPEMGALYPELYTVLAQALKDKNLSDAEIAEVLALTKWARAELNGRPHAYQACALTN